MDKWVHRTNRQPRRCENSALVELFEHNRQPQWYMCGDTGLKWSKIPLFFVHDHQVITKDPFTATHTKNGSLYTDEIEYAAVVAQMKVRHNGNELVLCL